MQKEIISAPQAICIITMFLFGSSVVMGINSEVGQDTWISLLLSMVFVVPAFLVYARIIKLFPGKDIYEVIEELFGKIFGKLITILIIWYAIHLGALVLKNFSEFITVSVMPETPELVIMISMILIVFYLVKNGIEILGRWSFVVLWISMIVILITVVMSFGKMNFDNVMPLMEHSIGDIAKSSYNIFSFPFAESVLFLTIACSVKKTDSPYKIYLYATLFATIIFLVIIFRNLTVLGGPMIESNYFPSYITARLIGIGDVLTRVEGTITINFILAGITKVAVCLFAATKGFSKLFNIQNYKSIVLPVSLLILAVCSILYENIIQMFDFIKIYSVYAIPFQIVIPLLIWIFAEIKNKGRKRKSKNIILQN